MKTSLTRNLITVLLALAGVAIPSGAVEFHVTTAQELQNALTLAAANGADDVIYVGAGYYTGNFNFYSAEGNGLTLQAEAGVTNTQITIDGAGLGRSMSLSCSVNAAITVRGLTFLRNCGNAANAGLRVATGGGGNVLIENCRFLSPTNTTGIGLELASGNTATVRGCIVTGGANATGTGISCGGALGSVVLANCSLSMNKGRGFSTSGVSLVTILGCTFSGNDSSNGTGGGGACIDGGATANVLGNTFTANNAKYAGGLRVANVPAVTISSNNFMANTAGGGAGGGCSISANNATLSDNTFTGNSAAGFGDYSGVPSGGGAYCETSSILRLTGNSFKGNSIAAGYGGGPSGGGACCNAPTVILNGNTFVANSISGYWSVWVGAPGCCGGGASCGGITITITTNTFSNNSATSPGDDYRYPINPRGGGIYCAASGTATFIGNSLVGNSVVCSGTGSRSAGGGVFCGGSGPLAFSGNNLQQNAAGNGGGLHVDKPSATLVNNLFAKNGQTDSAGRGAGVWVKVSGTLDMLNNTLFGNNAVGGGGGAAFQIDGTTEVLHVYNNIIWGNSANGSGADVHVAGQGARKEFFNNDASGLYGVWDIALNNLDLAPVFFDPIRGDYHLRSTSPCLNAGTNVAQLPPTDLDGNIRTNAAIVDIGAYEFNDTIFHPADANQDWVISATEYAAYAAAWKNNQPWPTGPSKVPADFVTRAGLLQNKGGIYHNDGAGAPLCWKPGPKK